MGNSNGRSCGSIQAGEYGATGFSPAAEGGDNKLVLKVQVYYKGSPAVAAVPEVKDAAGKVTKVAVAEVKATPDVLFPLTVEGKDYKTTSWSEEAALGSILAGFLYNLDKALTTAQEAWEAKFDEWETKKNQIEADNKKLEAKNKKIKEENDKIIEKNKTETDEKKKGKTTELQQLATVPAEPAGKQDFEAEIKKLQQFKAGWAYFKGLPSGEEKTRGKTDTTLELNKTPKLLGIVPGSTVVFVYDGAATLVYGSETIPAPKKAAAAGTAAAGTTAAGTTAAGAAPTGTSSAAGTTTAGTTAAGASTTAGVQ